MMDKLPRKMSEQLAVFCAEAQGHRARVVAAWDLGQGVAGGVAWTSAEGFVPFVWTRGEGVQPHWDEATSHMMGAVSTAARLCDQEWIRVDKPRTRQGIARNVREAAQRVVEAWQDEENQRYELPDAMDELARFFTPAEGGQG
jgi:hypothetical protein